MARIEEDREDLFAEVVSYHFRWEICCQQIGEVLVVGIRPGERWVVYRATGDYYQFLRTGELRRAFAGRTTYLSTGTTLAAMTKERTETETILRRHDLSEPELEQFLSTLQQSLRLLDETLRAGQFQVIRFSPLIADLHTLLIPLIQAARCSENRLSPALAR